MPTMWVWMGPSTVDESTQSVAPISRAAANFAGLISIAMIRVAPASFAACITERPTAPRPKTATELAGSTLHVFHTAPHPVETPQPSRHIFCSGALSSTFAHEISASTVYSEKVEHPMKW